MQVVVCIQDIAEPYSASVEVALVDEDADRVDAKVGVGTWTDDTVDLDEELLAFCLQMDRIVVEPPHFTEDRVFEVLDDHTHLPRKEWGKDVVVWRG